MLGSEPKKRFHEAVLVPEPSKRFANISNCQKRFFQNFLQIKFTHTRGGFKKTPSFHQSFKTLGDIQKPGENLVIFGKKNTRFFKITIFKNLVKTWWFFQISPGFHQVLKITTFSTICLSLVIFQNLVKTSWILKKSPGFHQVFEKPPFSNKFHHENTYFSPK